MNNTILKNLKKDLEEIKNEVFAIVLYGSYAEGQQTIRSDIDICLILKSNDKEKIDKIFKKTLRICGKNEKYDIKIFEEMPLYMKIEIINKSKTIYAKDKSALEEYFYFYRKLWKDQSVNWVEV